MDTNNKTNNKTSNLMERVKAGARTARALIFTAAIAGAFIMGDCNRIHRGKSEWGRGYNVIATQGINSGEVKEVKSIKDEYQYAEPWRALLHWYDPWVIRHVQFTDNSRATLEYGLFDNASFIKRKIGGPEPGEKYVLYKQALRYCGKR